MSGCREEDSTALSLYDLHGRALAQESLCPKGHETYHFGRPFLGHHYSIIVLSEVIFYSVTQVTLTKLKGQRKPVKNKNLHGYIIYVQVVY